MVATELTALRMGLSPDATRTGRSALGSCFRRAVATVLLLTAGSVCCGSTGYLEVIPFVLTTRQFVLRIPQAKPSPPTAELQVAITGDDGGTRQVMVRAKWEEVVWPESVWQAAGMPTGSRPVGALVATFPIAPTRPGRYRVEATVVRPDTLRGRSFVAPAVEVHARPAWVDAGAGRLGLSRVLEPWTPVRVTHGAGAPRLLCWNRRIQLDPAGALAARISSGKSELLAAPMQLLIQDAGGTAVVPAGPWQIGQRGPVQASCRRLLRSPGSEAEVTLIQEFDGLTWVRIGVHSKVGVDRLTVRIPLRRELTPFIYYWPDLPWYFGNIHNVVRAPREGCGWSCSHRNFFFFGGPEAGLYWASDNANGWDRPEASDTVQALASRDRLEVAIHILKGGTAIKEGTYEFALQITPVRPWPNEPLHHRVSCFNWDEDSLLAPYSGPGARPGMTVLDRMKQVGIEVVHLGEWWTTSWGGVTPRDPEALRRLADEVHRRDMQLIVYFGFEIDEANEDFLRFGWELLGGDPRLAGYRPDRFYPPERFDPSKPDRKVFPTDRSGPELERLLWGMQTLLTEYGVDGFYLDGTQLPTGSLRRARELMKRMRYLVDEYAPSRGVIYAHTSSRNDIGVNSFADVVYNGEQLAYVPELQGRKKLAGSIPVDYLSLLLNGRAWGLPHDLCADAPEYVDFALVLDCGAGAYQWHEDYLPLKQYWLSGDLWHAEYTPPHRVAALWPECPADVFISSYRSRDGSYTVVVFNARSEDVELHIPAASILGTGEQPLMPPEVIYSRTPATWVDSDGHWVGAVPAGQAAVLRTRPG